MTGERDMEEATTDAEEDRLDKKREGVRWRDGIPRIWDKING